LRRIILHSGKLLLDSHRLKICDQKRMVF
jgi:hypothetical protein